MGLQRLGAGRVGHLAFLVHEGEHALQVGQALLDLAVDHAQKAQWNVELDHEGIDHDQVAQRQAAIHHALRGPPEDGDQGRGDDQLLPAVEQAQRALALEANAAQRLQVLVVAPRLEALVAEVLDGLVVQQRVDGLGVGRRLLGIGLAPKARAPLGHRDRERDVEHQRRQRDCREPDVEAQRQDAQHQRHLDEGGQDAVERIRDQRLGAAHATLDVARHAAGLSLQVKAQAQRMQVLEGGQRNRARGTLRGLGKDQVAQLGEQRTGKAQQPVGQQQGHGHDEHRAGIAGLQIQRIDQVLQQHRHAHVGELGPDHEAQRRQHAPLVLPQVGQQAPQRVPVPRRCRGWD
ncbi:MAG: hypothetical protein GAK34_01080 [Delftia tsuruhatensis]|nr:MAG: hypothetical protein GAK34_01080 [Delftia tsuruhatensis]